MTIWTWLRNIKQAKIDYSAWWMWERNLN